MSLTSPERSGVRRLRATLPEVEPQESARRTYRVMLTEQIAPALTEWGFLGDGERFRFPSDVWHLGLGFASTGWSTVSTLRFDVMIYAAPREAWRQWRALEPALPEEPDPTVYYAHDVRGAGGLVARLGELAGRRADARWAVHAKTDPSSVAAKVLAAVHRQVLPAFAGRSELARTLS